MLEKSFMRLGKFSQRNKKKILVIWIVLFILMLPAATLLFTDTSYNVSSSIVTKNSPAYEANKLLRDQFGGSTDPEILIVANNTNLNNSQNVKNLINFQDNVSNYLKSTNIGYTNTTSIFTVENSTLYSFSKEIKGLEKGIYGLNELVLILNLSGKSPAEIETNSTFSSGFNKIFPEVGVSNLSFIDNAISEFNHTKSISKTSLYLAVDYSYNSSINITKGNPYLKINYDYYRPYLYELNNTTSLMPLVTSTINNNSYNHYPVLPSSYSSSSLLSPSNNTAILIFHYNGNLTVAEQNHITSIENKYEKIIPGSSYYLAGTTVSNDQLASQIQSGMIIALLIGIVISIIIVGLYFRSIVAAFVPFLIFLLSAVVSGGINGLIYKYIFDKKISFITPTLLLILILGIASDYSVYILSRYRSERRKGNKNAIPESAKWAGQAVFTSGATVALSYVVLWVSNIPIFSDAGFTNAISAVITIIAANTFLIALMAQLKDRIFYPAKIKEGSKLPFEHSMEKVANFTIKNKKKILVIFVVVTFASLALYAETPTNMDVFTLLPPSSGIQSLVVVNNSFHYDLFDPAYIILNFTSPLVIHKNNTYYYNTTEYNQILSIEHNLSSSGYVSDIYGIGSPFGQTVNLTSKGALNVSPAYSKDYASATNSYIGNNSHYAEIVIYLSNIAWSPQSTSFLKSIESKYSSGSDYKGYAGGLTEYLNNAYSFTSSSFSKMVPILGVAIFIILLIQLGSAFTPLRLILMVMAAVIMSLAITYIIFFYILHLPLIIFLPLFVFITLLAVGLDYDIFMVTKVRENVLNGMTNDDGIKNSIIESGGVIMTLGSLLFATFGALYFSGIPIMQEIGVGLSLGVLVDTFVSWMFFVPSVMLFLDKYNWWPSKMRQTEK
ncbi:MMPL family protein [Acidiplasma aeolicum]|uniref:MMPL family protein n=1 Tax=Acidiplasma aeolicum TaxID=507754 RepID=A0A0N8PQ20_9ARCH|nr:MMPL family transporter [Acidiplasma aeolicum]KPV45901.1 MMPL family protein [Acidiplasma aeolicum]